MHDFAIWLRNSNLNDRGKYDYFLPKSAIECLQLEPKEDMIGEVGGPSGGDGGGRFRGPGSGGGSRTRLGAGALWAELAGGHDCCRRGEGKKKEVAAGNRAVRSGGGGVRVTAAMLKAGKVRRQWGRRRRRWGKRRLPRVA